MKLQLSLKNGTKVPYFFCNKKLLPQYLNYAYENKLNFDVLVIRKTNPVPAFNNSFMNELEYIIQLRDSGVCFNSNLGYKHYKKCYDSKIGFDNHIHPNQKPLFVLQNLIKVSSKKGDVILDPFIGSGTTAVACRQLKRHYIGFEINKGYYNISLKRLLNVPKRLDSFDVKLTC